MIQCLILFQYLHANTDAARLKQASLLKTPNKSVQPPYRLSEADVSASASSSTYIPVTDLLTVLKEQMGHRFRGAGLRRDRTNASRWRDFREDCQGRPPSGTQLGKADPQGIPTRAPPP